MGYNFIVSSVGVAVSDLLGSAAIVDLDVTVTQTGVAPFYYPLSLVLDCVGLVRPMVHPGVEEIIAEGDSKVFRFATIPATPECLGNVTLSLSSPYAYEGRPVKFAQGTNGNVTLDLSMPPLTENTTLVPDQSPADSVPEVQVNFTLVQIIYGISRNVVSLKNGDTLDLAIHGRELNVRANVSNEMTSLAKVRFQYNGTSHLALEPPFALMEGSVHGIYVAVPYLASTGQKTIGAIVLNKTGAILAKYTIAFEVIDTSTAPPRPSPVAPPATNIFLTGHEAVPAPRHAPIKSPMAAATTSLNPVGANGNEAAATHVPTLAATFNDIHAFNTPSAPSLLELEDRQNQKKKHVTRIALTATGLGALAVVIAFYVVRMFRSSDSENDRLGTMPCFRQRRVDAINETRKKMTSRASSDDESWWSTSSSSSGNSSLAPSCDEQ